MTNLQSVSEVFERNYNNLIAIVQQRMELELQFHRRGDLQQLEPDLLELLREFGELLRVVYHYNVTNLLPHEAAWYASALSSRGSANDAFTLLVDSWIISIQGVIKPPECNLLANPLQELKTNLVSILSEAEQRRGVPASVEITNLVNDLIVADRIGAQAQLASYVHSGVTPDELITQFLLPAMVEIGRRWENNEIQIFEEHLATETIIRLLSGLSGAFKPENMIDRTALVSCVPNDKHQLVPMALSTFLELKGWRVSSLGSSLPAEQIIVAAKRMQPDAIFLSLNMLSRLTEALELISMLHQRIADCPIFIGGQGAQAGKSLLEEANALVIQTFEEAHQFAMRGSA
ncbi:cobalamin B12-binding domain protein [Candidatus Vecturithrix granuli]|uniref:Cobalamin B12-binding domain protein n=1 Tax=Vecturithrix granuli TaxID=1499967 RepID=A0A0S6WAJ3_VECG1|nr:cobalamin B12-binding domain protein [Candidatus Vecturithrix granuli]